MTLLYLALAYVIGIVVGQLAWDAGLLTCTLPPWTWLVPLALLPFAPLLRRVDATRASAAALRWPASAGFDPPRPTWSPALVAAVLLCLAAGALRYASHPLTPCWTPSDLAYYNLPATRADERDAPAVVVEGTVRDYPVREDTRQRLQLAAETLIVDGAARPVDGVLVLTTRAAEAYAYGQRLQARGRLATPPEYADFSYRDYLARQGIHSVLEDAALAPLGGAPGGAAWRRAIYALRSRGAALLNRVLPEPYAALANGMLLGLRGAIPDELYEQFNATGTSHVIVISGSNIALVAGLLLALSWRLVGRRRAIWPALAGIALYTVLVGAEASVVRAALMGGLVVIAAALHRRSAAAISLAAAVWVMALANPLAVWDVGFQLSAAATLGLILFSPAIAAALSRVWPAAGHGALTAPAPGDADQTRSLPGLLGALVVDGLVVTLAANILVLPLIAFYFGRVSLVGVLANLLIVPVQPVILLWGMAALAVGLIGLTPIAQVLAWVVWLALAWTAQVVQWTAELPGADLAVRGYGLGVLVITYATIAALAWRRRAAQAARQAADQGARRLLGPAGLAGAGAVAALVWLAVAALPDGRVHLHFLDVGQGDGMLIQTPGGRQVLIDGGREPARLLSELGAVMPYWDRSLDLLVLTHPDGDHMDAQHEVMRRYRIDQAATTPQTVMHPDAQAWLAGLDAAGVPVTPLAAGGWIDLGDGLALWVLGPPLDGAGGSAADDNENSLVLKVVYGEFSALLTGDAGALSEAAWLAHGLPVAATVLKVAHHGGATGTTPALVRAVDPLVAVIQVGAENRYGHPAPEVLANLAERAVLRNDLHGRVEAATDGRQMWLWTGQGAVTAQDTDSSISAP